MKSKAIFEKMLILATGIFLILTFSACGGGKAVKSDETAGKPQNSVSSSTLGKRYDVIIFQRFEVDSKIEADYPGAVAECEKGAISELQSRRLFSTIAKEETGVRYSPQTLLVQPKVNSLRIVSGAARFWGGALVGSSDMVVSLKMIDAASGMVVHEKVLSTANNPFAAAWTLGGSDRSLPSDMGKIISEYIVSIIPAR
jgi:hypothetical protein